MSDDREAQLLEEIAKRDDEIAALRAENRFLSEKIDALVKRVFGSSSEQMNSAQLELEGLLGKADAPALAESGTVGAGSPSCEKEPEARKVRRQRLPEHLPVEEEVIVPLEVQAAPEAFRRIGEEVSERLDYRPARYLRLRTVRPKFVSVEDKALPPVVAPVGSQLAEKLQATPSMISHVIVAKYADHQPLYRQAAILQDRHGLNTTRQTLCDWVMLGARWMRLIYEEVRHQVLDAKYVQADETPIRYLEPGSGRSQTGYFWTVHRPAPPGQARGPSFYQWHPSRSADCLDHVLGAHFDGVLQCDGYAAYESHARKKGLTLAACWAHARRKFHAAKDYDPAILEALNLIGRLYAIEERLRLAAASPEERLRVRQRESLPILDTLHVLLTGWQSRGRFLPRSAAGTAITYTLGLWKKLRLFAHDGRIEIDSNLCENAIRPTAVGKKNWLFIGAEGAGQNSAILFTLVAECRRLGLNPQAYFTTALTRLPSANTSDVIKLTPEALAPILLGPEQTQVANAA
jgi:transposase